MTEIRQIKNPDYLNLTAPITWKQSGHIIEAMFLSRRNTQATIKKLSKDKYIHLATGEIKDFQHKENRADNIAAVRHSLRCLRDYINVNATEPQNCAWITLTYAENMTDTKRLYKDFDKFIKRLRYNIESCEYIVAMEPQGRGAWHAHLLLIFAHKAPYIPNKDLRQLWSHGFVRINKLDNVDNVGAYLTAYLSDIELNLETNLNTQGMNTKKVTTNCKTKRYVKGGRLRLYPTGFNLYRISKGIKAPTEEIITERQLQQRTANAKLTYSKTVELTFEDGTNLVIYHRYYNTKRQPQKAGAA